MTPVTATMTIERDGQEFDVALSANYIPPRRATLLDPPEGNELEDIEATVLGEDVELDDSEKDEAEALLWRAVESASERYEEP